PAGDRVRGPPSGQRCPKPQAYRPIDVEFAAHDGNHRPWLETLEEGRYRSAVKAWNGVATGMLTPHDRVTRVASRVLDTRRRFDGLRGRRAVVEADEPVAHRDAVRDRHRRVGAAMGDVRGEPLIDAVAR